VRNLDLVRSAAAAAPNFGRVDCWAATSRWAIKVPMITAQVDPAVQAE